jgi:hypothetical protein
MDLVVVNMRASHPFEALYDAAILWPEDIGSIFSITRSLVRGTTHSKFGISLNEECGNACCHAGRCADNRDEHITVVCIIHIHCGQSSLDLEICNSFISDQLILQ